METGEILKFLNDSANPLSFLLSLGIIMALISGLVSKAAADYGGVFGSLARTLQRRKEQAIEADERSNARRLDRLEATIESLDDEITRLRERDTIHHKYQLYVAEYWRKLQFWAVEQGVTLPPPPMLSYPEWKQQYFPDVD